MSQNTKRILKYAGIGFGVGVLGFWFLRWWILLPGTAEEWGEGWGYLIIMPSIIPFLLINFIYNIDAIDFGDVGNVWFELIMADIGWGILGIISAEVILVIKLLIKKILNKIKEG